MSVATGYVQLTLRGATNDDVPFLRDVYATTRAAELAVLPWSDAEKQAFVEHQFNAQLTDYTQRYSSVRLFVAALGDEPVGRLFLADLPGEVRVLDIALLPAHRGRGFGTGMLLHVLEQAACKGAVVTLHVERFNPAQRLYERLGFEAVEHEGNAFYLRMQARPASLR